jgi:long-chain acyl-CoA synthetase
MRTRGVTAMVGVPLLYEKLRAGILRGVSQKPLAVRAAFRGMMGGVKGLRAGLGLRVGGKVFRGLRTKAGLGTVRLFICGGAPLPASIPQGFEDLGISFVQGYGLTETSPVLTVNPAERPRHGSVGVPVPGAEVRIDGEGPDGIGEIVARGEVVMRGYYNRPDLTAEVLRDGWFHTGDLGRFDRDGYLHISGRSKNVIVTRGGKNVYPEEVETVLNASPAILESLVYGIPEEDGGGEEIGAIVVPDRERFEQAGVERGEVYAWAEIEAAVREEVRSLNGQMADYKRIRTLLVREEELPKTSTRKVRRFAIPEAQKGSKTVKTR